jgi:hypothetical protein
MKKCMLIALITIFSVLVSGALCLAQFDRSVTNTSQKGSLLVWPLIQWDSAHFKDTLIKISNDYYTSVTIKCFVRKFPCDSIDIEFTLTPNQEISFLVSTGQGLDGRPIPKGIGAIGPLLNDGEKGELKCWAVDSEVCSDLPNRGQQIAYNWLSGDAIIYEGVNQHWEYSAYRFKVNPPATTCSPAGEPGQILLTGNAGNYDACPTALLFSTLKQAPGTVQAPTVPASPYPTGNVNNIITLVPCKQDFVDNNDSTVYAEFLYTDENEVLHSGAWTCVGCETGPPTNEWFSENLLSPKLHNGSIFLGPFATLSGSIYIHGIKKDSSCPNSVGVPLLGVSSMQFFSNTGPYAGETPTLVGPGQAFIRNGGDKDTADPVFIGWPIPILP